MKPQSQLADEIVELERSIAIARQRLVAALAAADLETLRTVVSKSRDAVSILVGADRDGKPSAPQSQGEVKWTRI
jgi:hypothetical protein